jgi:hypothetical protein
MSINLSELQSIFIQGNFDKNVVTRIMVLIRKLLEEKTLKNVYPKVMLYCDWTVHSTIDKNIKYLPLLAEMTDILVNLPLLDKWTKADDGGLIWNGDEALNIEVNKSLAIPDLRKQLVELNKAQGLPTDIFEAKEKWKKFSENLFQILMTADIKFPDDIVMARMGEENKKKIKKILQRIEQKSKGNKEKQVIKFSLVPRAQIPDKISGSRDKSIEIFFQMETKSGEYFVGPFWFSDLAS